MKEPRNCVLWKNPERVLARDGPNILEIVETYEDESHWMQRLLKCRECGQLYYYEFYEFIDWEDGRDPQYRTWIPVESPDEADRLKKTHMMDLLGVFPRLQSDFPKDADAPLLRWVT